jgi:hypothetical protein
VPGVAFNEAAAAAGRVRFEAAVAEQDLDAFAVK